MKGHIHNQIEELIQKYANGDQLVVKLIESKLFLRGIYRQKYDNNTPDDPAILATSGSHRQGA
ncbi:MAG: hypothetical protein EAZ57_06410 [Cytophagales bacterium]|nr:MAG: hypothetical protein EAZ67_07415 [Cytophagales bacterium]TAF60658.1 MAG: hypothetical protein EAZ57_06410 [Cytophagales bacterium]